MHHLGIDGYRELTRVTVDAARRLVAGVRAVPGLTVLGEPDAHVFTIASAPDAPDAIDVFVLGDALLKKGWLLDRQTPPDSLHATVSAANVPNVDAFLADLAECADRARATRTDDRSTTYATLE